MKTKKLAIFIGMLILDLYLIGCGPSQTEVEAEATQVAVSPAATQTAEVPVPTSSPTWVPPTNTSTPTYTSIPPTETSTSTSTPIPTDTPAPPTNTPTAEPTKTPTATSTLTLTPLSEEDNPISANTEPNPTPSPPPLEELVTFRSNAFAEFTGVTISFQQPRAWQTSYFSDSGSSGWLVSDADPNDAFWDALNSGEELVVVMMPVGDPEQLSDLQDLSQPGVTQFEADGKKVLYSIANGEVHGVVVGEQVAFLLAGFFTAEKETTIRKGIETIFTTLDWTAVGDVDLSDVWLLGTRTEGEIGLGDTVDGYVPLASISEWVFEGNVEQEIYIAVNTRDPEVTLVMDVLDKDGKSLLPSGPDKFTGAFKVEPLKLPADGAYTIRVTAPTGFAKYSPENPASAAKVYGWYQISMEAGKAKD